MSDLLPFVVIGIATGSVYGLAAMGLVLTYKTSGIFNFAHGSIAAVSAFVFYDLHALRGWPWQLALLAAVVVLPPVIALVMERITRGLAGGTATMKVVATIGLQLLITGGLMAYYGAEGKTFHPAFLPSDTVKLGGVYVGMDQLISTGVGAVGAVGFFVYFKISPMGVRMRAVVDNPDLLALAGTSPAAVRRWSWLIGSWFAAISGVLLAPQIGLDAMLLTLLVVQAYGAAAVGLFSSLPLTYAGGLLVGILAALATKFVSASPALAGLPPALPFLVLFVVLLVAGRGRLVETVARTAARSKPAMNPRAARFIGAVAVAGAVVVPLVVGPLLPVYASALVLVLIFSSLHLLVRTSGQISLAHAGLAAVGAAAFSHLAVGAGLPWLVAVLLAGVVAVPVGAIVAIPAIRLSGVYLALATYGFGLLLENVFYRTSWMFGATGSRPAPRPALFADDVSFYYVLLGFAVAGMMLVAVITRSRLGRLLSALADAPTTLSTLGLGVNVTRVTVFAVSAFIAGVAGALYAAQGFSASATPFTSFASLTWLALLVLNSGARSAAPVMAAVAMGVIPAYIDYPGIEDFFPVVFGLGALLVAIHESTTAQARPEKRGLEQESGSRAAERVGAASPAKERALAADAARRSAPVLARYGVARAGVKGSAR